MQTLNFLSRCLPKIAEGRKLSTFRLVRIKDAAYEFYSGALHVIIPPKYRVGEVVLVNGNPQLRVQITGVSFRRLSQITDADIARDGFEDAPNQTAREQFLAGIAKIYGSQALADNPAFWVYEFAVVTTREHAEEGRALALHQSPALADYSESSGRHVGMRSLA